MLKHCAETCSSITVTWMSFWISRNCDGHFLPDVMSQLQQCWVFTVYNLFNCFFFFSVILNHYCCVCSVSHRRFESVVTKLYSGNQCCLCSMRFTAAQTDMYADHLDWHFRQNHAGKVASKKVTHRRWYYSLTVRTHSWWPYAVVLNQDKAKFFYSTFHTQEHEVKEK